MTSLLADAKTATGKPAAVVIAYSSSMDKTLSRIVPIVKTKITNMEHF
jgi:acyl-CoA hydrolase